MSSIWSPDPQIPALIKAVQDLQATIEKANVEAVESNRRSLALNRSLFWLAVVAGALAVVQAAAALIALAR